MSMKQSKGLRLLFDVVEILVLAVVIAGILYAAGFRQAQVDGRSMEGTLQHGERLLLSNFFYTPERGDIVVINRYDSTQTYSEFELVSETTPLVKRVIGVGGDTVRITTDEVYVNGDLLEESYTKGSNFPDYIQAKAEDGSVSEVQEITVPDGCLFVLGDHRDDSLDSRFYEIGCIREEDVMGKAIWRLAPFGSLYE